MNKYTTSKGTNVHFTSNINPRVHFRMIHIYDIYIRTRLTTTSCIELYYSVEVRAYTSYFKSLLQIYCNETI